METSRAKRLRIAVIANTDYACYRGMLQGINAYAVGMATWHVDHYWPGDPFVHLIEKRHIDGAIISAGASREEMVRLTELCPRTVTVAIEEWVTRDLSLPDIQPDDYAIGRVAAEHFIEKGYTHFALHGDGRTEWSIARHAGYVARLKESGHTPIVRLVEAFRRPTAEDGVRPADKAVEPEWLASLPKPVALFADNDVRGRLLLELCHRAGLRVPADVAVLGVDNDELECEMAEPALSSVAVPWRKLGYEGARAIGQWMATGSRPTPGESVRPMGVIERASTQTIAIDDEDVSSALRFIRENSGRVLTVEDVLSHVPAGRRSLEKRFRERIGRSPLEEIRRMHVERAKQLLVQTDLSMPDVAKRSGFSSANWFCRTFHDLTGETPTDHRKRFRNR